MQEKGNVRCCRIRLNPPPGRGRRRRCTRIINPPPGRGRPQLYCLPCQQEILELFHAENIHGG